MLQKKRKLDQFELPAVDKIETRLNKLDPRLSTNEEIRDFVNEFDPNDLDIDSEAFFALPPEVQYEVIQDMMWKSRSTSWLDWIIWFVDQKPPWISQSNRSNY